jgi:hypothetical protein
MHGLSTTVSALLAFTAFLAALPAHADNPDNSSTRECVGRSEFALPGDAEPALYPIESVAKLAKPPAMMVQASYADGQIAGYTQWQYRGDLYVTRPATSAQVADILRRFGALERQDRVYAAQKKVDDNGTRLSFEQLSSNDKSRASRLGSSYLATWDLSGVVVHWSSVVGANEKEPNLLAYRWLTSSRLRAPFEIPTGQGVCLPSLFIPDDGRVDRFIASTYRLNLHPDVTVWVQDRDWDDSSSDSKLKHLQQAVQDSVFFWTQNYRNRSSVCSLWKVPHPIERQGIVGAATFVELERRDGTVDYGYFASFWGTPDSALAATQIKMFVIRDAQVAKAKGLKPVDRDQLLDMAEAVMRSVKVRSSVVP